MSRRLTERLGEPEPRTPAAPRRAVIALGANLGDRAATMTEAVADIGRLPMTSVVATARAVESVAVTAEGIDESAPRYLNSVVLVDTRLAPTVLLGYLHAIEARHGRERRERWGSRTLDLDLIAHGDVRADTPGLVLPHPRAHEREFVLVPWLSVDPDAVIPGAGPVADLLAALRGEEP
ncbi:MULTISPECIES: 2-amino-4-hydroxy-6-hydroxymethyldihydropteridine diphosphokinase [unclassified Microbacterium]|uniref:2-amino-4-hydroxy-6- hydroxymethyldihydropteridine diphosphokinase n=1 Tax=unclassified Microbacterium TaxID=2609290 RepID=UPI0038678302